GIPNQMFRLKYPNVINSPEHGFSSIQIMVNEGSGFESWTDATDRPEDIPESGKFYTTEVDDDNVTWIKFGDGVTGKLPLTGVDNIRATYRIGGGAQTNVGQGTINTLQSTLAGVVSVTNIVPATGGLDPETIEEARVMAPLFHRTSHR